MSSKITLCVAQKELCVEPYKYYVWPGEKIYKYVIESGTYYKHIDRSGLVLFANKEIIDIDNTHAQVLSDNYFENYFREILLLTSKDYMFDKHLSEMNFKKTPIIIGGCGRSGTTLLLSIFGAHDSIYAIDEETYAFYPQPYRLSKIVDKLKTVTKNRWCEKTPKNIMVFDEINNLFNGQVKLIHIIRDGRDVVTSIHPYHKNKYWVDIERWINDVSIGLKWKDIAYTIKYEDLVFYPSKSIKKICDYVEEPFYDNMLDYYQYTNKTKDVAWDNSAQKINKFGVGKWQDEKHKERIEEMMSNCVAVELLKKTEYLW